MGDQSTSARARHGVKLLTAGWSSMTPDITVKVLQQTMPINVKVLEAFRELLE